MNAKVAIAESAITLPRGRVSDYFELTKPRVVLMVLVTTLAGFYLGGRAGFDITLALNLLAGTALAAGGTLALNEYVERDTDAMMDRTRNRPLPDMRMRPAEALTFGVIATVAGFVYLTLATNLLCTAVTAAVTIIYLGVYTPLKRYTWMCNIVGAIPGALPPVAGWAAAHGGLSWEPIILFAIMFLWQLPHTMAVARLYRTDYERAGIHLLPQDNTRGGNASNPIVIAGSLGTHRGGYHPDHAWLRRNPVPGNRFGDGRLDARVWSDDGAFARQFESGAPVAARVHSLFANRVVSAGSGSRVSNRNAYACYARRAQRGNLADAENPDRRDGFAGNDLGRDDHSEASVRWRSE